jgi:hypothetical protein
MRTKVINHKTNKKKNKKAKDLTLLMCLLCNIIILIVAFCSFCMSTFEREIHFLAVNCSLLIVDFMVYRARKLNVEHAVFPLFIIAFLEVAMIAAVPMLVCMCMPLV